MLRTFQRYGFAGLLLWLLIGCQGEPGQDGVGFEGVDFIPPAVIISSPSYGTRVYGDTLHLAAEAVDTIGEVNSEIDRVEFFVNGSSLMDTVNQTIAEAKSPPYAVDWVFQQAGTPTGVLVLQARAFDDQGNLGISPGVLILRKPPSGLDTLAYDNVPGSGFSSHLQSFTYDSVGQTEAEEDTIFVLDYSPPFSAVAVRYTVPVAMSLQSCLLHFSWPSGTFPGYENPAGVMIRVRRVGEDHFPGELLGEVALEPEEIRYGDWLDVSLASIAPGGQPLQFEQGDEFYIEVQGNRHDPSERRSILIKGIFDTLERDTTFAARSLTYGDIGYGDEWMDGIQEARDDEIYVTYIHWRIRAVLSY